MPFSNTAIEGLLKRHGLAVTEDGIMLLRGDLEIAEEGRASTIPLKAEPARRLVAAIDTVMEIAEAHELVSK